MTERKMKKDSRGSKDSTEPGPSAGAAKSRKQGDHPGQHGRQGEDGGAAGPQGSAHAGSYDGPNTGPSTGTRMRAIWHGEGIPMDMLFRDDRDGYGHGPAPVEDRDAPGPLQADRPGSHVAVFDAVIDGGRGPAVEPEETGGEAAGEGARATEDETTEQPLILVPLIDPDTGKEFVYPPDLADPAPAVGRPAFEKAGKPDKREEAAPSEPAAATDAADAAPYAPAPAAAQVPAPARTEDTARTEDAARTEDTARTAGVTRTEDTATAIAGIAAATALADAAGRPDARDSARTGRGVRTGGGDRDARSGGGPGASGGRNRRRAEPRPDTREAPEGDADLVERSGPALSGWWAIFVGLLALGGCGWLLWHVGVLPEAALKAVRLPVHERTDVRPWEWAAVAAGGAVALLAFGGLTRGRVGCAWVLSLFGRYRGSVRRTGLVWISPLVLRRRVDVRLRHWRSEPMAAVDAKGVALRVVVLVVWRVRDTARATLAVDDYAGYLSEQVEAAMARVLSQLPADAFHDDAPTLRDAEAVGDALTQVLSDQVRSIGVQVFSAQPTRIEYAPEVAAAMQRSQIAAIDAKHRDSVLTSVVDAVDDTVSRLTARGLVELDDYERKALVKDLTVAFYTARGSSAAKH
ncbi:SPFH domain-containing protein [Streptomyces sp. NPDC050617]|uniref:SPFH domain-containing protein n=1 Tax=Streptomyces sp. NPDC050617 TaxID=3154628 RepID=UPI0034430C5D